MDLDYFEVEINGRTHPVKRKKVNPSEELKGKSGYQIWIWDSNIEAAKFVLKKHKIEFIVTATQDIDYLKDSTFSNIKGVIIHREVSDLNPLSNLKNLKYLEIFNEGQGAINFEWFPNLIEFNGYYSKKYSNLKSLKKLKYLSFLYYRKKDLKELSYFRNLKHLHLSSSSCQNLNGVDSLEMIESIDIENCKKFRSFDGVSEKNIKLKEIKVTDCPNLSSTAIIDKLPQKVLVTIDGVLLNKYVKPEKEISLGHWMLEETKENSLAIQEIESILHNLKAKLTPQNWKKELIQCVEQINEIHKGINLIYTGESEELINAIQQIAIEVDTLEIDLVIDEIREW